MPAPPNPAPGDILKVTAGMFHLDQLGEITCGMSVLTVVGGGLTLNEMASAWLAEMVANFVPLLPGPVTISAALVELFNATTGKVIQSGLAEDNLTVGAAAGNCIPTQVAVVVTKRTGYSGRKYRGRVYFPFLTASGITAQGELVPTYGTSVGTAVGTLFATQTFTVGARTVSVKPVLIHRSPLPLTTDDITTFVASVRLGTQRRRGDYGRLNSPL